MTIEVSLRFAGTHLEDPKLEQVLFAQFPDALLMENKNSYVVTLFLEESEVVEYSITSARQIEKLLPELRFIGVDRDFVGVSEIAQRIGVTREGARKWTADPKFPVAAGHLQKGVRFWVWVEVLAWLKSERELETGEELPNVAEMSAIDAAVMRNSRREVLSPRRLAQKQLPSVWASATFTNTPPSRTAVGGGRKRADRQHVGPVATAAPRTFQRIPA